MVAADAAARLLGSAGRSRLAAPQTRRRTAATVDLDSRAFGGGHEMFIYKDEIFFL